MPGIAGPWLGAPPVAIRMYFRRDGPAVGETQRVRILDHRARLDDLRRRPFPRSRCRCPRAGDLLVLVGDQGRPVEGHGRNGPAESGGVLDLMMNMRADHEQLLGDAAADHAGAAHPVLFGDHHPRAITGGDPGGAHAARASSDHEKIDVELSHFSKPRPRWVTDRSDQIALIRSALPRLRISARNSPLTISANCCAHWFM